MTRHRCTSLTHRIRPLFAVLLLVGGGLTTTGCRGKKVGEPTPTGRMVEDALSFYEMGRQLELHGNYESAIDKYTESIRISPRPVAHFALGSLQAEFREFEKAKANLRQAIAMVPGYVAARRELERVEAIEQLLQRGEPIPESLRTKPVPPSLTEQKAGEATAPEMVAAPVPVSATPGAEAAETRVAPPELETLPPTATPAVVPSVTSEPELPDLTAQEMPPVAEKLSEEQEARIRAFLREGQLLLGGGGVTEAIRLYQEALLDFPREGRLHYNLGYSHQWAGNNRAALLAYEDAVRFGYSSPALYNNLGLVYEYLGNSRLAVNAYRRAIEMANLADARYNLAMLLEKRGELEEALREFEAYLNLDATSEFAERARAHADRLRRRVR